MAGKSLKKTIVLPPGRISYPFLAKPDVGREYSDNAYKFDLMIPKSIWNSKKTKGVDAGKTYKEIVEEAILAVGRDLKKDPTLKLDKFKHPIKDLALDPKVDAKMKDFIMMRAKNKNAQPLIVGIEKTATGQPKELTQAEIAKLKGGDWVEAIVDVYSYTQQGGGVTLGLNVVRFLKTDEAFGANAAKHLGLLDDIEVTDEGFSDDAMEALAAESTAKAEAEAVKPAKK